MISSSSATAAAPAFALPQLPPALPRPRHYRPRIGLIGCGNIASSHLEAYRADGWEVAALCDTRREVAAEKARQFYPDARVLTDYRQLLDNEDVDVVDLALHPEHRVGVIEAALHAGKHVLSQKPFALDLATGRRLVRLAADKNLRLAVNQNARWAPYLHYLRSLCAEGQLGQPHTAHVHLNWDHTWIRGMDFEDIHHIVLYDFAIHWIDFLRLAFRDQEAQAVFATVRRVPGSEVRPPLAATATIAFESGVANLLLDGNGAPGAEERITLTGSEGTVRASGELHAADAIELTTRHGRISPMLEGRWYREGFRGAMGELLCAIEEDREPDHSAADNLRTLELLFALVASADTGQVQRPGEVDRVGDTCRIKRADPNP